MPRYKKAWLELSQKFFLKKKHYFCKSNSNVLKVDIKNKNKTNNLPSNIMSGEALKQIWS